MTGGKYLYSRWDSTQSVFDVGDDALMDQFSDSLLSRGDVSSALRSLTQRGLQPADGPRVQGVQDMLQQLRSQREETLRQSNLDSPLDELIRKLAEVVATERQGLDARLDSTMAQAEAVRSASERGEIDQPVDSNAANELTQRLREMVGRHRAVLDGLPPHLAAAVRTLNDYDFMDQRAQRLFDELKESMQRQFIDRQFQRLTQSLTDDGQRDLSATKEMLQDLNRMIDRHLQGVNPRFEEFMERWGSAFGDPPPQTFPELIDHMQRQAAQMTSLLSSLSPGQRQELDDLVEAVLTDADLRQEMADLLQNLQALSPTGELGRRYPFHGDDPLALDEALDTMERLQRMDALEQQLKQSQKSGNTQSVEADAVRDLLGQESHDSLEELRRFAEKLENAGYIREGEGEELELTPRGIRRIGQHALTEIFSDMKKHYAGTHATRELGGGGEPADSTKPYEFGDQFSIHLQRTIHNAILRGSKGMPVTLTPNDFEVYRIEEMVQSTTVLLVDLSLSMAMRGNFLAAKKVALALDTLIRTQFQRDRLYIVGFSTYAREMKPAKLAYLSWDEFEPYTNIQHGLSVAQKLLARHQGGSKQIIMISDGEPTAHMENGQMFLQYPPSPRTLRETLKEVKRVTQSGVTINTFMLERNAYLVDFVDEMTRINKGRVFYTTSDELGEYILVDYLSSRRRRFVA
ncbi:MAG: VWA domain-containing protein [Chloroflexi bacterium]|nr:VWA domain-containing protein [Chloroflexota bacterium]